MSGARRKAIFLWMLLGVLFVVLQRQSAFGTTTITLTTSAQLPNNYNVSLLVSVYTNLSGDDGFYLTSPLVSVTNGECNVPFQPIQTNGLFKIYSFGVSPPVDALSGTFTLTWTNYTTNFSIAYLPIFPVEPQSQSVLVGGKVCLTAQAIHTTGYQWQRGGTNLVENGHFAGVTNSMLTITNVQSEDAGDYIVIANHPTNSTSSFDAYLSVFKPIQLGLVKSTVDGGYQLLVNNQNGDPVDDDEVSHFVIYTTADLSLPISNWDVASATGVLTNGIYEVVFSDDGSLTKFWEVGQQP
jgi:hypothetical protein